MPARAALHPRPARAAPEANSHPRVVRVSGQPCRITFTKLARALWNAEQPGLARGLVPQMEAVGIVPDAAFYRAQIAAAESMGMHEDAEALHREASERGLEVQYAPRGRGRRRRADRWLPDRWAPS